MTNGDRRRIRGGAMTIEEAKALLPPEMKYPLPDDVLMNLLDVCAIPFKFKFDDCENGLDYATLAAVIELIERRRGEDKLIDAANEEWRHKRIEVAVKYNEKFKRELIAKNERLSERLNELQTLFPQMEIPAPNRE